MITSESFSEATISFLCATTRESKSDRRQVRKRFIDIGQLRWLTVREQNRTKIDFSQLGVAMGELVISRDR